MVTSVGQTTEVCGAGTAKGAWLRCPRRGPRPAEGRRHGRPASPYPARATRRSPLHWPTVRDRRRRAIRGRVRPARHEACGLGADGCRGDRRSPSLGRSPPATHRHACTSPAAPAATRPAAPPSLSGPRSAFAAPLPPSRSCPTVTPDGDGSSGAIPKPLRMAQLGRRSLGEGGFN